jgi:hypothetical protein
MEAANRRRAERALVGAREDDRVRVSEARQCSQNYGRRERDESASSNRWF